MSVPSRPPVSTLWGHLLRKQTLASPSATIPLPPTAPLDKTGTSMRILLHDTQANFEKFSARVDALTTGMDDAKREIVTVKNLFQEEHDLLTTEVVDLVNRSQTQIQKSLGVPAQAEKLEMFRKDVDLRLDGLTKRIDDIQSVIRIQEPFVRAAERFEFFSLIKPILRPCTACLKRFRAFRSSKGRYSLPSCRCYLSCKPFLCTSTQREATSTKHGSKRH
ncbi:hypothetical protein B0H10DRAFT_1868714 [Mycena sp. CBHHK59/15]|nr:hypothetical protein B0H10DRAFT_1868714 [Mycena sp. CBHHK59/15]